MATNYWLGQATAVAQLNTITPANVAIGNTFTVTINGKSITFTATVGTVANVTAGLSALLAASTIPEFAEITWADATTAITATAKTAGYPFTNTSSASGGTATLTTAITTASAGPNDWSSANNWSLGTVPAATNDVIVSGAVSILYGLDQNAVTLTSLSIDGNFTGYLGLPERNPAGYDEYRQTYLKIGATTQNVGAGPGFGSGRIKIEAQAVLCTVNVYLTGTPAEQGIEPFLWKGTNASNAVNLYRGSMGVAIFPGETATIASLRVSWLSNQAGDANFRASAGVTLTTIDQSGGAIETRSNLTTKTQTGGTHVAYDSATLTTLTISGGTFSYRSSGALGTANVSDAGVLDFSGDLRAKTVTVVNCYAGATVRDPHGVVSWGTGLVLQRCSLSDVTLDVGPNKTIKPT